MEYFDGPERLTDSEPGFSRVLVQVVVGYVEAIDSSSLSTFKGLAIRLLDAEFIWLIDQLWRDSCSIPNDIVEPIASVENVVSGLQRIEQSFLFWSVTVGIASASSKRAPLVCKSLQRVHNDILFPICHIQRPRFYSSPIILNDRVDVSDILGRLSHAFPELISGAVDPCWIKHQADTRLVQRISRPGCV